MSDEVGNLTNIANVVGDAFGQGASATLSGLLGNGVNAITNAISRGDSGGGANLAKCPFFGKTSRENPNSEKWSKKEGSKTMLEMIAAKF